MRNGRAIPPGVKFAGESIEGPWVVAEKPDVKHIFRLGEIEMCQIGVQACIWRPEIRYACRGADAGSDL